MSRLPFELSLALRYLRPKRTFVSVITLISIIGVMLGVAVLIIVIAVMSGFDREWRERILSFNAHLKIVKTESTMPNYALAMSLVATNQNVKGVAPYVLGQVLVKSQPASGDAMIRGPVLRGIDPRHESNVSVLPKSIAPDKGKFDLRGKGVVVGTEFARDMRLNVGDHLAVYSPRSLEKMEKARNRADAEAILPEDFEVRGIFDVGFNDFNFMMIVTSLENAQELYGLDNAVHGLYVMLHDPFKVNEVRDQLQRALGPDYHGLTWMEENSQIFGALATEKTMMYVILFIVMIVASFAIVNSEITFAVNKMKEIGLLKALGAYNRQVMVIFLSHSMGVGLLGVGLGLLVGRVALAYMNNLLNAIRSLAHIDLLPAGIYQIHELPYLLLPMDVAIICGGGFLICVLAGFLPAWQAARLAPVEALRNE
ncbi:MAG: ABC transporter permease [Pedosphaera sp.]|nr:ABC transporter permease [Pedosphaera sp.]